MGSTCRRGGISVGIFRGGDGGWDVAVLSPEPAHVEAMRSLKVWMVLRSRDQVEELH